MATVIGNIEIGNVAVGGTAATAIALGNVAVWRKEEPAPAEPRALKLTAPNGNAMVMLTSVGTAPDVAVEYSTDGSTWSQLQKGTPVQLTAQGSYAYFRAGESGGVPVQNTAFAATDQDFNMFYTTGVIDASGDLNALLDKENEITALTAQAALGGVFYGSSIRDASQLQLPATTVSIGAYLGMFYNCASLTAAPELPATTLAYSCYQAMFFNCASLAQAPALPATTLDTNCYNCMFYGCSALTAAPALPATTLALQCYNSMFNGCSSLSSVEVAFTTWTSEATNNWLYNVAASGTFKCPDALDTTTRDVSHVPVGWNVKTPSTDWLCFTSEEADSTIQLVKNGSPNDVSLEYSRNGTTWYDYTPIGTVLSLADVGGKLYFRAKTENSTFSTSGANYYKFVMTGRIAASGNIQSLLKADCTRTDAPAQCYRNMFNGCSSLTTAPSLPATTLASQCYRNMFNGCSSLTTAPSLPATTLAEWCYYFMFQDCTSLTIAPSLPATTLASGCYAWMFNNCTSLATAPALPATTIADDCYQYMFQGCTSLTTAPTLPATTLVAGCYDGMFQGCSSLSSVEVAFTTWTSEATDSWLQNVTASGTFTCPAALPDVRGHSNIPSGWTKVDAT